MTVFLQDDKLRNHVTCLQASSIRQLLPYFVSLPSSNCSSVRCIGYTLVSRFHFSSRSHSLEVTVSTLSQQLSTFASRSYQLAQLDPSSSQLVSRSSSLSFNWFPEAARSISIGFQKQLVPLNFVSLNWIPVALIWIPEAARAIQLRSAWHTKPFYLTP
jgi:hypothetical protein